MIIPQLLPLSLQPSSFRTFQFFVSQLRLLNASYCQSWRWMDYILKTSQKTSLFTNSEDQKMSFCIWIQYFVWKCRQFLYFNHNINQHTKQCRFWHLCHVSFEWWIHTRFGNYKSCLCGMLQFFQCIYKYLSFPCPKFSVVPLGIAHWDFPLSTRNLPLGFICPGVCHKMIKMEGYREQWDIISS